MSPKYLHMLPQMRARLRQQPQMVPVPDPFCGVGRMQRPWKLTLCTAAVLLCIVAAAQPAGSFYSPQISKAAALRPSQSIDCRTEEKTPPFFDLSATEESFSLYFPTYLANGYFTATTSIRGTDATLSFMAGLMDYTKGDVSRPAAIPSWTEINYFDGASYLNNVQPSPTSFKDYRQTLHMYDGLLSTQYTWVNGSKSTDISVCTLVSESDAQAAATRLTITPNFSGPIKLLFTLRPHPAPTRRLALAKLTKTELKAALGLPPEGPMSALRPPTPTSANRSAIWYPGEVEIKSFGGRTKDLVLWLSGQAINGAKVTEAASIEVPRYFHPRAVQVHADASLVEVEMDGQVVRGQAYAFTKYVAAARARSSSELVNAASSMRARGFTGLRERHLSVWHELWTSDIVIKDDPVLQTAVHSDLFYLLENSTAQPAWPMGACGITPNYLYHVFWDNDSWDFPVMLLLHPERAKSLVMFRFRTLPQAEQRARKQGFKGALYPWESDPALGTEQTPYFAWANADREIHIDSDVAIAQWQYYLNTRDKDWLRRYGYPVMRALAQFWAGRVTYDRDHDRYEILHVTSPDEAYDDVRNDSYTNAAAQKTLQIASAAARVLGVTPAPQWNRIAEKMYIPLSTQFRRHLDFDESVAHNKKTWAGSNLTQLSLPSLDLSMTPEVRRNDFDFAVQSASEQTSDANQMWVAMFPIAAATLGLSEQSSEWLLRNLDGFLEPPFNVRSETTHNNTLYILATSSGFLQDFLYGFTGMRFSNQGLDPKYPPILPSKLKEIRLHKIFVNGRRYDFTLTRDGYGNTVLTRKSVSTSFD